MSESKLTIQAEKRSGVTILYLKGVLDAKTAPEFDASARRLISAGESKLVCDLKDLTFIASAGLGVLAALRKQCIAAKGDVRISRPGAEVLDVFELLSFSKLFKISHRLEDSLVDF